MSSPPPDDPLIRFVRQHLALFITGATTLIFLLKVLKASDWHPATAVAVANAAAVPSLLFGLAASLLPGTIAALLVVTLGIGTLRRRRREPITWAYLSVVAVVGALAIYAVPTAFLLFIAVLIVIDFRRKRPPASEPERAAPSNPAGLAFMPFAVLLLILLPDPWPAEQIAVAGQDEPLVVFVLEEEGPWVTVLRLPDRDVSMVRSSAIRARAVCRTDQVLPPPLTEPVLRVLRPQTVPDCP